MNIKSLGCAPVVWTERVFPNAMHEEYAYLRRFFHGRIVQLFCRGGRWGQFLTMNGHIWYGMDTDGDVLEQAFLRGVFSVSVGLLPPKNSCDMIFAPMPPFSMIVPDNCDDFVQGMYEALSEDGTLLVALWEEPQVQSKKPLMYTYNGKEKLVLACTVDVVENVAKLEMEWMIAQERREPYFVEYTEERYLHCVDNLCSLFSKCFRDIEIVTLAERKWLFAKKP